MTRRRPPDFDLLAAARSASFTPRAGDVDALIGLLAAADDATARAIVRALARVIDAPRIATRVEPLLRDPDARTRRRATTAFRHLGAIAEAPLVGALDRERDPATRRAIVEALGTTGGAAALARVDRMLAEGEAARDPQLARVAQRARLKIRRTIERVDAGRIDDAARPPAPIALALHCRAGLESILAEEVPREWSPSIAEPGVVRATLVTPLRELFLCRTMLRFGLVVPREAGSVDEARSIADALSADAARAALRAFTVGPIRWRLELASGHRRAVVWRCAQLVAERAPELQNDPTTTTWDVIVRERELWLSPRRLDDPRFTYRKGDVPAASHPTLAAAVARVAGAKADDVVWDPFVGSGTELVERARLGPASALIGTDVDPAALAIAAENLAAARVDARLAVGDARTHRPGRVTQILTNPPMGRRVLDRAAIGPLYDRFLVHAAEVLAPGGRLVFISPLPSRTLAAAERAGLTPLRSIDVDMGGFTAQLQAFRKPRR